MFLGHKLSYFCSILLGSMMLVHGSDRILTVKEYRDKMSAGWIGQMVGVSHGAPTEFRWGDKIIPEDKVPQWTPQMINDSFAQDDLYVEMTFLRTLEQYGVDCSIRQAGIDFANSGYPLWCANNAGRKNLRKGIAPPDSSHPQFNKCPNDIDYQIEADYSGLIAPGIPQAAVDLGEKFGRLMNYGDGMYAGQFIGALYAEAFFESDPVRLTQKALEAIPSGCQYAEMVRDMLEWYSGDPINWQACWEKCQKKYREDPEYQKDSNGGIDCKINGAYVLLGLLYGHRDLNATIVISMRAGQDSDCNPSSSGGILFTTFGYNKLPDRYLKDLQWETKFSHTDYNFKQLLDVCQKLATDVVVKYGGKVVKNDQGEMCFIVPDHPVKPSKLVSSWNPEPIENSRFTDKEMSQMIWNKRPSHLQGDVDKLFPGWKIINCGDDMNPGVRSDWQGQKDVLCVHPLDREIGCSLIRTCFIPNDKPYQMHLIVGNDPQGDFDLVIKVNDKEFLRKTISNSTTENHWMDVKVDLSQFAGTDIKLELINQPTGWEWEAAYWKTISFE